MDQKFRQLIELGAGKFEHVEGGLIEHLEATRCLLKSWSANESLQDAGLYYVAYSQDAIPTQICNQTQRCDVAAIVGQHTESIIFHHFVCDREPFLAQFQHTSQPVFYNRLSEKVDEISTELLSQVCELMVASEIELRLITGANSDKHKALYETFLNMGDYISPAAQRKIQQLLN